MLAAIIRFHRANDIPCYKAVSYPTTQILSNIFFSSLQINIFYCDTTDIFYTMCPLKRRLHSLQKFTQNTRSVEAP